MAEQSAFRPGDVSYLRIPARDLHESASFYATVLGWETDGERGRFHDAGGYVIGHFDAKLPVAGDAGVQPYVYVDDLDAALSSAREHGAEVVTDPYPEGNLLVARVRDPAGNVVGIWTRA